MLRVSLQLCRLHAVKWFQETQAWSRPASVYIENANLPDTSVPEARWKRKQSCLYVVFVKIYLFTIALKGHPVEVIAYTASRRVLHYFHIRGCTDQNLKINHNGKQIFKTRHTVISSLSSSQLVTQCTHFFTYMIHRPQCTRIKLARPNNQSFTIESDCPTHGVTAQPLCHAMSSHHATNNPNGLFTRASMPRTVRGLLTNRVCLSVPFPCSKWRECGCLTDGISQHIVC